MTHINAYKEELVRAERDADKANARVEELKAYIEANEPEQATPVEEVAETEGEEVEVKTSKKAKTSQKASK